MVEPGYDLTPTQRDALRIIQEMMADSGGIAPTYQELTVELDLGSRSNIARIVGRLEDRGYIRRLPYRARAMEVLRPLPPCDCTPLTWFPAGAGGQGEVA